MKKVMLFLVLGIYTFGSSGFKIQKNENFVENENCDESFNTLREFALNNGASEEDASNQAGIYWANCIRNGGDSIVYSLF